MARRFIVQTQPTRFFAFAEPSPFLSFNDPRRPPLSEAFDDVIVAPFFGATSDRYALPLELSRLIDDVYRETADQPARILLGRFTFLELSAVLQNLQEERIPASAHTEGAGTIVFRGVPCVLTPGEEHHAEAVPSADWLLSRKNPQRFRLYR